MSSLKYAKLPMVAAGLLLGTALAFGAPKDSSSNSKPHHSAKAHKVVHHSKTSRKSKRRGQQAIDSQRTTQIQQALIREHYLSGEPSGAWDASTQEAMRHYQSDQGWQTKIVPDSRALIRLGLGPNHDHLLNPESAMVSGPAVSSTRVPASSINSALPGNRVGASSASLGSDFSSSR